MTKKKIIIIGGGFGGLTAARLLAGKGIPFTLIDRTNHHLFQPLLYQVATASLSPGDIAVPIRGIFKDNSSAAIFMSEVIAVDTELRIVKTADMDFRYDYLVIAPGSRHSYFGRDNWEEYAPGLKTLNDALTVRERILCSLEEAEKISDLQKRKRYLNFVIVGGGPTGVEMAGAVAEIVNKTIIKDYKNINAAHTRVFLVEALPRILSTYPQELSLQAQKDLENLGVEVILNTPVSNIDDLGAELAGKKIESVNIIWAAGNQVSGLIKTLNTETDRAGRAVVNKDLSLQGHPEVFVIGDAALCKGEQGNVLPAVAPVAIQQGRYVAKIIAGETNSELRKPFQYSDRGSMATIGRAKAVAEIKGFKLKGFIAWLAWSLIHILFLIGFRNRFRVMAEWFWYYVTFRHGIRLIVGHSEARNVKKLV